MQVWNILLRKSQLEMILEFRQTIESGGSICRQLIMGSGKTTVRTHTPSITYPDPYPS